MRPITLRLEPGDYERLEAEAARLGVPPATLARMYIRARLNGENMEQERRRRLGQAALDRLARLTTDLPGADAVEIARESREELEGRSSR